MLDSDPHEILMAIPARVGGTVCRRMNLDAFASGRRCSAPHPEIVWVDLPPEQVVSHLDTFSVDGVGFAGWNLSDHKRAERIEQQRVGRTLFGLSHAASFT